MTAGFDPSSELPEPVNQSPVYAQQGINMMPATSSLDDLDKVVKHAEKFLAVQGQVRKMAINLTNIHDWVDEGGQPYLQERGTQKIAMAFGVSIKNVKCEEQPREDDDGKYITFYHTGEAVWQGRVSPQTGTCSTRDKFFGRKAGGHKPLKEVDLDNVRKKSMTNFLNRCIKSALGLSFTWEEIEQYSGGKVSRANLAKAGKAVAYDKGTQGGTSQQKAPETQEQKDEKGQVWWMMKEMYGSEQGASEALSKATSFQGENGIVPGKTDINRVSDRQMKFIAPKVKDAYNKWKTKEASGAKEAEFTQGAPLQDDPNA